jgi:hypothetical protein
VPSAAPLPLASPDEPSSVFVALVVGSAVVDVVDVPVELLSSAPSPPLLLVVSSDGGAPQ